MVTRITDTDASRLGEALTQLYAVVPDSAFPDRALAVGRRLIDCIHCSYNEINVKSGRHRIVVDPPELMEHEASARFALYVHQHPVIAHVATTGDQCSHLISDFVTAPELHRLELFTEFFRPLETESQLSNTIAANQGRCVIGLAFNRGSEGFSDRDRLVLDLLRPHLVVAHDNAVKFTAALAELASHGDYADALARLTDRQRQILRLVADGRTNAQISFELDISPATAKKHVEHILERLGASTRTAAAARYLTATRDG